MKTKAVKLLLAASLASALAVSSSNALAADASTIFGLSSGTTGVTYDNASGAYPVIEAIVSQPGTVNGVTYTSYAMLAADSTGSLEVYGALPTGYTGATPAVGDAIDVSGEFYSYHSIPEIENMTSLTIESTGNAISAPQIATVSQINTPSGISQPLAGQLLQLNNVTISGQTAGEAFGTANLPLTVTDGTGSETLYYWPSSYSLASANLDGVTIPTGPVNIEGIASVYGGTSPEFIPIQITPVPEPTSLALFGIGGMLTLTLALRRRSA
jgi:hypothetical protein